MKKIVLIGAGGMLGMDLAEVVGKLENKFNLVKLTRKELDITDGEQVSLVFSKHKPDIVINASAYTEVDKAESERDLAFKVNGDGVKNIALSCKKLNSKLVHLSTDYVFDGTKKTPYKEDDDVSPIGVYGLSKLQGENFIKDTLDDYLIVRTSWLYGPKGNNFVATMIRLMTEREEISVVGDQIGCPTYTVDLADAIVNLIDTEVTGVFHFTNEGETSWYDFAVSIKDLMKDNGMALKVKNIISITTKQYPTPAKRPKYSRLSLDKYKSATGKDAPFWKDSLVKYFKRITS